MHGWYYCCWLFVCVFVSFWMASLLLGSLSMPLALWECWYFFKLRVTVDLTVDVDVPVLENKLHLDRFGDLGSRSVKGFFTPPPSLFLCEKCALTQRLLQPPTPFHLFISCQCSGSHLHPPCPPQPTSFLNLYKWVFFRPEVYHPVKVSETTRVLSGKNIFWYKKSVVP